MTFNLEPCKCDKLGRNVKDYRIRDFYEKISEELFEAHDWAIRGDMRNEVAELLDIMTVCAARINAVGISDEKLATLQKRIIEHNRARGYFEEVTHG